MLAIHNIVLLILLFALPCRAHDVVQLNVESNKPDDYLPFTFEITHHSNSRGQRPKVYESVQLYSRHTDSSAQIIKTYNGEYCSGNPAIFNRINYPGETLVDDDPVYLEIRNWRILNDTINQNMAVVGAGYWNDTAYAFYLEPESEPEKPVNRLFLCTGEDRTGDGQWKGVTFVSLLEDYDYDGYTEMFIFVSAARDIYPRRLYCVEIESFRVEWFVDVPSTTPGEAILTGEAILNCRDSLHPAVMFTTITPSQGYLKDGYSDSYSYLFKIDFSGEVSISRKLGAAYAFPVAASPFNDNYFIGYQFIREDTMDVSEQTDGSYYLSEILPSGETVRTIELPFIPKNIWSFPFGVDRKEHIAILFVEGILSIYNSDFQLIAQTEQELLPRYLGRISISGYPDELLVFSNGLYNTIGNSLEKVLGFPISVNVVSALQRDSEGHATTVVICSETESMIGEVHKKTPLQFLSIFYHNNQMLLVSMLSALIVGLIIMNYYRSRARITARIISRQNSKLEEAHIELQETQEKLVAAEKYKQAQDIAGGFAHEIRNALLPAETAIDALLELTPQTGNMEKFHKYSSLSAKAIERAIRIISLISNYTKLESEYSPEIVNVNDVVDTVIQEFVVMSESNNIAIVNECKDGISVIMNFRQLHGVLSNIYLNAVDALKESQTKCIVFSCRRHGSTGQISVNDNGIGISEKDLPSIFNTFYSTKPSTGTGLGLSISKKIIEMYGGQIEVTSQYGHGAHFKIILPLSNTTSK